MGNLLELPTNTAGWYLVGPFLDKTDGITPELSITVANSAITLEANANAESAPTLILDAVAGNDGTNTLVHVTDDNAGMYYLKLTASNNNRYGSGMLTIVDTATYVTVFHPVSWVSAAYWNWKYGTTKPQVNTVEWDSHAVHAHTVEGVPIVQLHENGGGGGINAPLNFEDLTVSDTTGLVSLAATQDVNAKTITNGAINNASFNADVGSTAYATNIIALAVRKVLDELKLDHLIAVAESDDPVDNSIVAKLASSTGDWSTFVSSTDSSQAVRDRGDAAWTTATGFSTHSADDVKTAMEANGSKLDHLWEMTEDDGGTRRLTANALEEAPSGSGLDAAGVRSAIGMSSADMDTQLSAILAASGGGSGASDWSYTVTDSSTGNPIAEVTVWITTDAAGSNTIASASTNASGIATMRPDVTTGTQVYVWCNKTGYTFENPQIETVTF